MNHGAKADVTFSAMNSTHSFVLPFCQLLSPFFPPPPPPTMLQHLSASLGIVCIIISLSVAHLFCTWQQTRPTKERKQQKYSALLLISCESKSVPQQMAQSLMKMLKGRHKKALRFVMMDVGRWSGEGSGQGLLGPRDTTPVLCQRPLYE